MSRIYFATVVAAFVTTSLATNLLVVGTRGPVTSGLTTRLRSRSRSRRLSRRFGHFVNNQVAAMIARREQQATICALRHMSDRDLKDIGLYRGGRGHFYGATDGDFGQLSISRKIDGR
jgi:uncharacterized protein YjiS (DUF1127 family)